jgi:starch phosphorylase
MTGRTRFPLQVIPALPEGLARLADIAGDLWYAWNRPARELFSRLHPELWEAVGHSPKAFLRQVEQARLQEAAASPAYEQAYKRVLATYDAYLEDTRVRLPEFADPAAPVAYFCAEFGFHESLPIYSGGLGILAGDHLKAASDLRLPLVGVGLLYRQGYFNQTLDEHGGQVVAYADADFADLPLTPVLAGGNPVQVSVELPGRRVYARAWQARIGHAKLFLLDTDVPENDAPGRDITRRLYGGDRRLRLEQEIVLGMGGARLLAALGIRPGVWHINEGHAALLILERVGVLVREAGLDFPSALEAAGANTVFTTHTPVPAGHDQFPADMVAEYFDGACHAAGIERADLLALGRLDHGGAHHGADFNLTAFAMRGARFHNGVSRLHGAVTAKLLQPIWPQVPHEENPVGYVTNGIHVPTFLAPEWSEAFERYLGLGWRDLLEHTGNEAHVDAIPDEVFWSIHQNLKSRMLRLVRRSVLARHLALGGSEAHAERMLRYANPDDPTVLTIGFSRRFATYKRAGLLFRDLDWLRRIVAATGKPVLFLFAGKAHPADEPGQRLIRDIAAVARRAEFEDKVLLLEGYDISIARRLVTGVDVWLNTPIRSTEASGTSGMKAGINGVLNLSVLDGWWDEGYERGNGWAIRPASPSRPQEERDAEEARAIYELMQDEVVPLYYGHNAGGWSRDWVRMAKRSMASLLPRFSAARMVGEYAHHFYAPARAQAERRGSHAFAEARTLSAWKARVRAAWPGVYLRRLDEPRAESPFGARLHIEVELRLAGLSTEDVAVELVLEAPPHASGGTAIHAFNAAGIPDGSVQGGAQRYVLDLAPEHCGKAAYAIRVYPRHPLLTHPFEPGLMKWL